MADPPLLFKSDRRRLFFSLSPPPPASSPLENIALKGKFFPFLGVGEGEREREGETPKGGEEIVGAVAGEVGGGKGAKELEEPEGGKWRVLKVREDKELQI